MKVTESGFIESNGYFYPPYPREQVLKLLDYLKSGDALDVGAGFGNNVEPLLEASFNVVATETNPECIETLNQLAKNHPGKLAVVELPFEQLYYEDGRFDAVICTMVLHFLTPPDAKQAIANMQAWTKRGGFNVVTGYTKNNPDLGEDVSFLFNDNELKDYYRGWEILTYEEVASGTNNPLGQSLQSARLMARKPTA